MSNPNLMLIKTIDLPGDELTEEFKKFKETIPEGTQMSMFDIIVHDEETWFTEAIEKLSIEDMHDPRIFAEYEKREDES